MKVTGWFAVVVFSLVTARADASVLVVGSGQPFTQITTAVAAAQDGDTILVKSGWYAPFTIDGKGLTLVGDQGAIVFIGIFGLLPQQSTVKNLTVGQTVVLRGIDGPLALFGNAGSVRLEGCSIVGQAGDCSPLGCIPATPAVDVRNCAPVAITRSSLEGGAGGSYTVPGFDLCTNGAPGLAVENATVALYDTNLAGGTSIGGCSGGVPFDAAGGTVIDGLAPQHDFVATSPLRKQQLGSLDFAGAPGDLALLLITAGTDFLAAPEYQGALLVGPILGVAIIGPLPSPTGVLSLPLFIGDLPPAGTDALDLHLQAAYAVGGAFVLAEPSIVTVLDASF